MAELERRGGTCFGACPPRPWPPRPRAARSERPTQPSGKAVRHCDMVVNSQAAAIRAAVSSASGTRLVEADGQV